MPWVLDGNNLAGGRERSVVRAAALDLARSERIRIVLFFDGAPPPGAPEVERLGRVEVRYVPHADGAIVDLLARSGRGWRLATDDAGLARRAKERGATVVGRVAFWSRVGRLPAAAASPDRVDVGQELAYFRRGGDDREDDRPRRVPRRRRR